MIEYCRDTKSKLLTRIKYVLLVSILFIPGYSFALEDYSLNYDLSDIPTQISVAAAHKKYAAAGRYCKNLSVGKSKVYRVKGMVMDKSKLGKQWRVPTFDEILIALLIDDSLTLGDGSERYLWTSTADRSQFGGENKQRSQRINNDRLIIRPSDRSWHFSNGRFTYDIRCVR